jgi:hypothetical protein
MLTQDAINFEQIVESIRTFDSPIPKEPAHVESSDSVRDTMMDLIEAIHKRDFAPEKCAYYMHPTKANELLDEIVPDAWTGTRTDTNPTFQNRPIRTHPTIPEDVILFLAPDAITLGGKIYAPEIIAYAD